MDELAFLQAIADAPEDFATRLVYADWLDEHDRHEQAQFLRLEYEWFTTLTPLGPMTPSSQNTMADATTKLNGAKEEPPLQKCYPPALRQLTELANKIDLAWMLRVSCIRVEIRNLVDHFKALVQGSTTGQILEFGEAAEQLSGCFKGLKRAFTHFISSELIEAQFVIPVDYLLFLSLLESDFDCPEEHGMPYFDALFGLGAVPTVTIEFLCDWGDIIRHSEATSEALAQSGLWLFAGFRDKHDFHLCCDTGSPYFGSLVDYHDSHPWISPPHTASPSMVRTWSFIEFFRQMVAEAKQDAQENL